MLVSLDVMYMLRAFSLRDTVAGSVENSCHKQIYKYTRNSAIADKPHNTLCKWYRILEFKVPLDTV